MSNKIRVLLLSLFVSAVAMAQSLSVESFKLLDNDLTANTRGTMKYDQNGDVSALIKVVTTETDFNFDVGSIGVVGTSQQKGEIWVYVPGGAQRITISHSNLGVLRDYYFPIPVESARTYELKLISGKVRTIVEQSISSQFVVFKVQPKNSTIYIDEELRSLDEEGVLSIRLPYGNHSYRIMAPSFVTQAGVVEVGTTKLTKEISLLSAKASLSIKTSSDAEIWVNDNYMGIGSWEGDLEAGVYLLEAKRKSHRTISQEIILSQQEKRSITLPSPEAILGSLEINGSPVECDYYIDGQLKGSTPDVLDNILIGNYKIEFKKRGYITQSYNVEVKENETSTVTYRLEKQVIPYGSLEVKSKPKNATVLIDDRNVGETPITIDDLEVGSHKVWVNKAGYLTYFNNVTITEDKATKLNTSLTRANRQSRSLSSKFNNPNRYDTNSAFLSFSAGYDIGKMGGFVIGMSGATHNIVCDSWYSFPKIPSSIRSDINFSVGLDLGLCVNPGAFIQIVPKVGISYSLFSFPTDFNGYSYQYQSEGISFNCGSRFQVSLGNGVGLFLVPEFRNCTKDLDVLNLYGCDSGIVNGFYMKIGLEFLFNEEISN